MQTEDRLELFPLGAQVRMGDLARDPYPILRRLQHREPVTWVPEVDMWFVTRRADIVSVLRDWETFTTNSPRSTIRRMFGEQMLSVDGETHRRYRRLAVAPFRPGEVRDRWAGGIRQKVTELIDALPEDGSDLRHFAGRVAVHTIVTVLGLPVRDYETIRSWYDDFAGALANFAGDPELERRGRETAGELRTVILAHLPHLSEHPDGSLLSELVHADDRMSDDRIVSNAFIVLFGGIETTESMILNALWAILSHPDQLDEIRGDGALLSNAIEESMRWEPAVQSATRHVVRPASLAGVDLAPGETVQCMLGGANRDPEHFVDPDRFDIHRPNAVDHLTFGYGRHFCLGAPLGKLEAEIAIGALLEHFPSLALDLDRPSAPEGYEFRKPPALWVR